MGDACARCYTEFMNKDNIPLIKVEERVAQKASAKRDSLVERYPMTFALIGTFGFVSTLYGFEKLIDKVDIFANNPWILLATGITILSVTGLALRKLG